MTPTGLAANSSEKNLYGAAGALPDRAPATGRIDLIIRVRREAKNKSHPDGWPESYRDPERTRCSFALRSCKVSPPSRPAANNSPPGCCILFSSPFGSKKQNPSKWMGFIFCPKQDSNNKMQHPGGVLLAAGLDGSDTLMKRVPSGSPGQCTVQSA